MKQLVIFQQGTLSAKDKERMSKEGYLAIESSDPARVVMPLPSSQFTPDEMLRCALYAIENSAGCKDNFVSQLIKLTREKQSASK